MIPQLALLADSRNQARFENLSREDARTVVRQFVEQDSPCSKRELAALATNCIPFVDLQNRRITAYNKSNTTCFGRFLDRAVYLISLGQCQLQESTIDKSALLRKIKTHQATFVIQQAWRGHFRRTLERKKMTFEEWRVSRLQTKWLEDPAQEYARLSHISSVTCQYYSLFAHLMIYVKSDHATQLSNLLGRVQELKEMYKGTHYVFTHGQSLSISLINQTVQEAIRLFTPVYYHPFAPTFRIPGIVPYTANITAFFQKYNVNSSSFNNNTINAELLSVDGYLWNMNQYQSAIDFLSQNNNICTIHDANRVKALFCGILAHYLPNDFICTRLAEKLNQLSDSIQLQSKIGILYAIAIPKVLVTDPKRNFIYRAHPLGNRCDCHPLQHIPILEALQANQVTTCTNRVRPEYSGYNPQYRFLTARMLEDGKGGRTAGVRAFGVDALPHVTRSNYTNQIAQIMRTHHFYTRLFNIKQPLTASEEAQLVQESAAYIQKPLDLDRDIVLPLIRAKMQEKAFSSATRDALLRNIGIVDTGVYYDDSWIDKKPGASNLESLWTAATSAFSSILNSLKFW